MKYSIKKLIPISSQMVDVRFNLYKTGLIEIVVPYYVLRDFNFKNIQADIEHRDDSIYIIMEKKDELK